MWNARVKKEIHADMINKSAPATLTGRFNKIWDIEMPLHEEILNAAATLHKRKTASPKVSAEAWDEKIKAGQELVSSMEKALLIRQQLQSSPSAEDQAFVLGEHSCLNMIYAAAANVKNPKDEKEIMNAFRNTWGQEIFRNMMNKRSHAKQAAYVPKKRYIKEV